MTSRKKRAFHFGGASGLLLCAMADGALAQDAAAPSASTPLPEITVTAPSPIVRRKPAPIAHAGARRPCGARPEPRAPAGAAAPVAAAAAPQHGVLPVVTDQFATVTVVPNEEIRRSGSATLGDLLFSKPGITGSSFAPGASSRPIIRGLDVNRVGIVENGTGGGGVSDLGEDHFVPDRSARHQPGRSRARTRDPALRLDLDRRRRQRDQQPHSGGPALLPGRAVPELRAAGQGAAGGCAIGALRHRRDPHGASARSIAASKAASCSMPAAAILPFTPTPMAARPTTTAFPAIPICSTRRGRVNGRQPNSARASRRRFGRRLLHLPRRLHRRRDHAEQFALSHPRHRRRRSPDPHRRASDQVLDQGRIPARRRSDRCRQVLGRRHRLQAQRDRPRRSRRPLVARRAADLHQQGAGRPRRGAAGAVQCALCCRHHRVRPAGEPPGTDGAEPGRSRQPAQRSVGPEQEHQRVAGYVFNEFKFTETTKAQIAGRIEHVDLSGTMPSFIPELFDLNANPGDIGPPVARNLNFTPKSAQHRPDPESCRGNWSPASPRNTSSARRSRRNCFRAARTTPPRPSTSAIPISVIETAKTIEIGLRRATGPFRFEATAYYTKFNGFILPPSHRQHLRRCRLRQPCAIRPRRSS